MSMAERHDGPNGDVRAANTDAPPPLDSKESRTAMNKILNAVEDLTDEQRMRVLRAAATLYGIKLP